MSPPTDPTGREETRHASDCDDWECTGCLDARLYDLIRPDRESQFTLADAERVLLDDYGPALAEQLNTELIISKLLPHMEPVRLTWRGRFYRWKDEMFGRVIGAWEHLRHGECFLGREDDWHR